MKKIYLLASMACMSLLTQAQTHSTNFDTQVDESFLTKSVFGVNQSGSNLIIESAGHDEWAGAKYQFNDGVNATPISMTKNDTVYIRVKADYNGNVKPRLGFGLSDVNGVGPNNELYNSGNVVTLTNDWQIVKFTVKNWTMEWGDPNDPNLGSDMDSMQVAYLNFAPNNGFASQKNENSDGDTIVAAFSGKIYVDYIGVGTSVSDGVELQSGDSYDLTFDSDESLNITSGESFTTTATGTGTMTIESAGHGEWESVRYTLDKLVDLTSNPMIEFTASAVLDVAGEVGFAVVAVDEAGNRLETPGVIVYQSLSETAKSVQYKFDSFTDSEGAAIDETKIAYLDILINTGFSSAPQTNELGKEVNSSFVGTVSISSIKLGEAVEPNGLLSANVESLSFYPNPAVSSIVLGENLKGASYSIISLTGSEVQSGVLSAEQLSVSDLEEGMYIIQATLGSNVYTNTFVKQ